jgi:hypothetical protein
MSSRYLIICPSSKGAKYLHSKITLMRFRFISRSNSDNPLHRGHTIVRQLKNKHSNILPRLLQSGMPNILPLQNPGRPTGSAWFPSLPIPKRSEPLSIPPMRLNRWTTPLKRPLKTGLRFPQTRPLSSCYIYPWKILWKNGQCRYVTGEWR